MRRFISDMNPTLRGFIIVGLIALVVVVLQLYETLIALGILLRIVFFIAIAVVIYFLWRDRLRHEIDSWGDRQRRVFYGAAALIVADLAVLFWPDRPALAGLDAIAFLGVLVLSGVAMWRVWRDQQTYTY
jgi:amino acid transporter